MKRSSNWDEKLIEQQLRQLPKIEDKQSKDLLFERIQEKMQEQQIHQRKKQKNWVIPTVAAAAVFFLMLLIVPSFLNEQNMTKEDSLEGDFSTREIMIEEDEDAHGIANIEMAPGIASVEQDNYPVYLNAAQPIDLEYYNSQLAQLAVPVFSSAGEFVVTVSLLADGKTEIDRFLAVRELFSGEVWGIGRFPSFSINSIYEEKGGILVMDVPTGTFESLSATEDSLYKTILKETFWPRFREIEFRSDGQLGVIWGQTGPITNLNLEQQNRSGYYFFETDTGFLLLVKGNSVNAPTGETLYETLLIMKQSELDGLQSIPEYLEFVTVEDQGDLVTIHFQEGTIFEDSSLNLAIIEAILFTAKDFGYSFVKFKGVEPTSVGHYLLTETLVIPEKVNFIR